MPPTGTSNMPVRDVHHEELDLGPLAWVHAELRKTLDNAVKQLQHFAHELDSAGQSDLAASDPAALRTVRQMLHQCAGALVMVGMAQTAVVLQAMEAAVHRFVQEPERCNGAAVAVLESTSFAVIEYLDSILAGKVISPVALFPQYRQVQALAGTANVHPMDLWPAERRAREPVFPGSVLPLPYGTQVRSRLDAAVLRIVKNGDAAAAVEMQHLSMGLAAAQQETPQRIFWKVCAGFFEALGRGWLGMDTYAKRTTSRVLMQYATLARGGSAVDERLQQELLFFCAQARMPEDAAGVTALRSVRSAWAMQRQAAVDYESARFGLFDPTLLAQARKRIAAATETWSALAGGDTHKIKPAVDQFSLVCDSLRKLQLDSEPLAAALLRAVAVPLHSTQPPPAPLGMEVATAVLYLQASFEELDAAREHMADRASRLAARLDGVVLGGESQPLEPWMEELYRRVSDYQTMGSVVGELRVTLADVEKSLDEFFRNPSETALLNPVPGGMQQMRGVLSVLGLDQASTAVLRMRDVVERLLTGGVEEADRPGVFERLGNSLGALGFLVDMLGYQRAMAAKLFVYDEALGEFRFVGGTGPRTRVEDEPDEVPDLLATRAPEEAAPAVEAAVPMQPEAPAAPVTEPTVPEPDAAAQAEAPSAETADEASAAGVVSQAPAAEAPDPELLEIFIEEAREVVANGLEAVQTLQQEPGDMGAQAALRRAYHTLKGSSRMVGLNALGEAAWAMEEVFNDWLVHEKPASALLLALSHDTLAAFGDWVQDLSAGTAGGWSAEGFRMAADTMRTEGVLVPWSRAMPQQQAPVPAPTPTEPVAADSGFGFTDTVIDEDLTSSVVDVTHAQPLESPSNQPLLPEDAFAPAATQQQSTPAHSADAASEPEASDELHAFLEQDAPPAVLENDIRQIGELRVPTALYNVYLNEADGWSARLLSCVQDWAEAPTSPVPEDAVALTHSLAGSSATVGFMALSQLARMMEHALQHLQLLGGGQPEQVRVMTGAADEIRRLLHQFAAGFLKDAHPPVVEQLEAVLGMDLSSGGQPLGVDSVQDDPEFEASLISRLQEWRDSQNNESSPPAEPAPEPEPLAAEPALALPVPTADADTDAQTDAFLQEQAIDDAIAQAIAADADEDDIDLIDTIDPDLFPIFEEEAQELLPQLSAALRQWSGQVDDLDARRELLRALHTLKGSARLAGALRLGEMAHRMESAVEAIDFETATAADVEPLMARFDALQTTFDALRVIGAQGQPEPAADEVSAEGSAAAPAESGPVSVQGDAPVVVAPLVAPVAVVRPVELVRGVARAAAGQQVRVRSQLLDRMVNDVGEVLIARSRLSTRIEQMRASLDDLGGNLERMRAQLRDVELQAESQMQSRQAQARDSTAGFDPLEFDRFTRMQELTRMMAESVNDVATVQRALQRSIEGAEDDLIAQGRQARELQRELLRTRMVEFDSVAERLYAVVRQAARETGKQVRLDIVGGTLELDRGVLERMVPAFEHLLRNCVAHGIEASAVRETAGKPATGAIAITVGYEGNDVSVEFRDDGAGLDLERIRERALTQGLIGPEDAVDASRAAELIYLPGFSTATELTGLSGRGIGMDVVRAEIQGLGGRIETTTTPGQGSSFRMVLPLTTAVTQVVMVRVGNMSLGIPANVIEVVRRAPAAELAAAYASGHYQDAPLYWAGALLQTSTGSAEATDKTRPVIIARSASQRLALHVDEVLGNQEVVVKSLGPQLSGLPGLTGMTVLASGAVVLIYNPVALANVYGEQARTSMQAPGAAAASAGPSQSAALQSTLAVPLVLVVDDSITVRRVTQRLLQREGYRVALAADGLQALQRLREERPVVVLSDIEMPRMDGFDLARAIRADSALADLPIVMITSRMAEKHREHAVELGVSHYLGKPYAEEELLGLVRRYAEVQTVP